MSLAGLPEWCDDCARGSTILDSHWEQIGWEEQAYHVLVLDLTCGHEVQLPN